jgi:hypothetical protein
MKMIVQRACSYLDSLLFCWRGSDRITKLHAATGVSAREVCDALQNFRAPSLCP